MALFGYIRASLWCGAMFSITLRAQSRMTAVVHALPGPPIVTTSQFVAGDTWISGFIQSWRIGGAGHDVVPLSCASTTTLLDDRLWLLSDVIGTLLIVAAMEVFHWLLSGANRQKVSTFVRSIMADIVYLLLLCAELGTEFILVASKWCLCCRRRAFALKVRKVRSCILRRKRAADVDDVTLLSPAVDTTPEGTRRPIALSALRQRLAEGGILMARRCSNRRFMKQRAGRGILYNPHRPGDCLFACIAKLLKSQHGIALSPKMLRRYANVAVAGLAQQQ
eukprot:4330979-Amphidinium_carterae.1